MKGLNNGTFVPANINEAPATSHGVIRVTVRVRAGVRERTLRSM